MDKVKKEESKISLFTQPIFPLDVTGRSQGVKLDKIPNLTLKWNFLYNVCLGKWDQTEFSEKVILPISF